MVRTTRPSNVRVCQFRHSRVSRFFPGTYNIIPHSRAFVKGVFEISSIFLRNFVFDALIQDFRGLFGGLETGEAGRGLFFYDLGERFISAFASFDAEKDGFYG